MADEMFVLLGWAWDVDTATRLAKRYPVRPADIRPLTALMSFIKINAEHAATADLTRPLLIVAIPNIPAPGNRLVIDGWHRLHRAITEGVDRLPAVLLDAADERACRLRGGDI